MENWQTILFDLMRGDDINKILISFFMISWIFVGNFILLNLFLAILLDSFFNNDEKEDEEEEMKENIKDKEMKLK